MLTFGFLMFFSIFNSVSYISLLIATRSRAIYSNPTSLEPIPAEEGPKIPVELVDKLSVHMDALEAIVQ